MHSFVPECFFLYTFLMSDKHLRSTLSGLKGFAFDEVPWTTPKPLHESRVAIVTTAGLRVENDADWNAGDQGFTQIPHDAKNLTLAHYSPNFDRIGGLKDDIPKGWIEETRSVMVKMRTFCDEMEDLLVGNEIFQAR